MIRAIKSQTVYIMTEPFLSLIGPRWLATYEVFRAEGAPPSGSPPLTLHRATTPPRFNARAAGVGSGSAGRAEERVGAGGSEVEVIIPNYVRPNSH